MPEDLSREELIAVVKAMSATIEAMSAGQEAMPRPWTRCARRSRTTRAAGEELEELLEATIIRWPGDAGPPVAAPSRWEAAIRSYTATAGKNNINMYEALNQLAEGQPWIPQTT